MSGSGCKIQEPSGPATLLQGTQNWLWGWPPGSGQLPSVSYFSFANCYFIEWRRHWHPTPVLLPGKSHGWRSLVGCSPWGCKESDTAERLHFHSSLSCTGKGNGNPLENPRVGGAWWAAIYGVSQSHDGHDLAAAKPKKWFSGIRDFCRDWN